MLELSRSLELAEDPAATGGKSSGTLAGARFL